MAARAALALCVCLLAVTGAVAQTLGSNVPLPPTTTSSGADGSAPGPGPALGPAPSSFTTINAYLQYYSSTYSNFIDLINAASSAPGNNNLTQSFNDPATSITLFAATNAGMNASLASVGSRPAAVERSPALSLKILQYNILPSPITPQAFRFSNGFNTIFVQNNQNTSVGVINANGQYPRLQGLQITMPTGFRTVNNSALRADEGTPCGMSECYTLQGILLPPDITA